MVKQRSRTRKYDLLRPLFPQTEALLGDADDCTTNT